MVDLDAHGDSPALFKRLRDKEARKREIVEALDEAIIQLDKAIEFADKKG